jgi:hypothetical protein
MNVNYSAVSACAAVIAGCIAIIALLVQDRRSRFSHGVDILFKLSDEFSAEAFRCAGTELAQLIQKRASRALDPEETERFTAIATEFLNHFETLGFLLRKRILDKEMIYTYYFYRLHGFWRFLQEVISITRADYPLLWSDAEWLHDELVSLARKQQPKEYIELTDSYVSKFIEYMATERAHTHSAEERVIT